MRYTTLLLSLCLLLTMSACHHRATAWQDQKGDVKLYLYAGHGILSRASTLYYYPVVQQRDSQVWLRSVPCGYTMHLTLHEQDGYMDIAYEYPYAGRVDRDSLRMVTADAGVAMPEIHPYKYDSTLLSGCWLCQHSDMQSLYIRQGAAPAAYYLMQDAEHPMYEKMNLHVQGCDLFVYGLTCENQPMWAEITYLDSTQLQLHYMIIDETEHINPVVYHKVPTLTDRDLEAISFADHVDSLDQALRHAWDQETMRDSAATK